MADNNGPARHRVARIATAVVVAATVAAGAIGTASAAAPQPVGNGGLKRLHYFTGNDGPEGFGPYAPPIQGPDGQLYGTTSFGGPEVFRCDCSVGGTIFRMTLSGTLSVLHTFTGPDGIGPISGLAPGADGRFYGFASGGGDHGAGTLFAIDASGNFTLLHSFGGGDPAGARPLMGALALGPDGQFYGVTTAGGAGGRGTLFRMATTGDVTVLHAFAGGAADGAAPRGGVTFASDGNAYGTTMCGGPFEQAGECAGTVYRWSTTSGYTLLHGMDPRSSKGEGTTPQAAPAEAGGFLYGTSTRGGAADAGAVWRLPLAGGALKVLHPFAGGVQAIQPNSDGKAPSSRLVLANDGRLYGTTASGGPYHAVQPDGDGILFSVGQDGSYKQVFAFGQDISTGSNPLGGLSKALDGTLFGATESGDSNFTGIVFSWASPH